MRIPPPRPTPGVWAQGWPVILLVGDVQRSLSGCSDPPWEENGNQNCVFQGLGTLLSSLNLADASGEKGLKTISSKGGWELGTQALCLSEQPCFRSSYCYKSLKPRVFLQFNLPAPQTEARKYMCCWSEHSRGQERWTAMGFSSSE